ncbi:hypothetical protein RhiJN_22233 [Ceratobasidium sp. AG-Ba]|nr:hypothetical protein RhiJN_22233 [Ceratobasidium sp. AG-Ba]
MPPALETQVNLLATLINRLATVRAVSAGNLPVHLQSAITNVSSLAEELASSDVQDALAAAEMEPNIRATDLQNSRREIRRQRQKVDTAPPTKRPPTKTQYYPPRLPGQMTTLSRDSLPSFVESFNRASPNASISIWSQTDSTAIQGDTLRVIVPDILVGYITLREGKGQDNGLRPDSVSIAGIREQRTTSEFSAFRSISQHIFKIMGDNDNVTVSDLAYLLASYHNLYLATCHRCTRICSAQDYAPATVHIWTETDQAQWTLQCYHDSCAIS